MIGVFAVNLHGFSRTTGDLDIWLKDEIIFRRSIHKLISNIPTIIHSFKTDLLQNIF
jgi:hypothetical protein